MSTTPLEMAQLWRRISRQMRLLFRSAVEASELPPLSFLLLKHVHEEPGITLSELARNVGVSKSYASTTTEQLVQGGYMEKRSDPSDQRLQRLYVTPDAKRKLAGIDQRAKEIWTAVFEELPGRERPDVQRLLRSLLHALERVNERSDAMGQDETSEPSSTEVEVIDR